MPADCPHCLKGFTEEPFVLTDGFVSWRLGLCRCPAGRLAGAWWRFRLERHMAEQRGERWLRPPS